MSQFTHACEGATALGSMLSTNTTLKELSVAANGITSKGATALAGALKNNPKSALSILKMEGNPVGDEGATAIAQSLVERTGRTLKTLHISMEKGMTVEGREALRKAAEEACVELGGGIVSDDSGEEQGLDDDSVASNSALSGEWTAEEEEEEEEEV
jgi:hypothetical protein